MNILDVMSLFQVQCKNTCTHAVYKQMIGCVKKAELPREIADIVANAMKDWAMDKVLRIIHIGSNL